MTPDLYVKASDLVGRLLELDTTARKPMLDAAERADPGVVAIASQLLSDIERAGDFLEESAAQCGLALIAKDPYGLVGQTLDDTYRVERLIGVGGVGAVYKARHVTLPRHFAIKVIPELVSDKVAIEGAAGSLIHHPAVVAITDHKLLPSGAAYLAMDYVEGTSLREELVRRQQFGFGEALDIVSQVASALDAAHEAGFVHRDIKPENILIVSAGPDSGRVRVIDFGIAGYETASRLIEDPELTGIGIGTPGYMSPEQWSYEGRDHGGITARSDVYSLAVVFFELLTGRRPVDGNDVGEVRAGVIAARHQRLSEFLPELPAYVVDAVSSALSIDPADRPASAGAFVTRLGGKEETGNSLPRRQIRVPASLVPIERFEVGRGTMEFYEGDLMAMPRDWDVDYLVVSLFRDDYWPTDGSLLESLEERGVDVGRLARNKRVDARDEAHCWLSQEIGTRNVTIPVRHIIAFEPEGIFTPADKIEDFFRFLRFVTGGRTRPATVAMPLLGTGGKMGQVRNLVPPLIESAIKALRNGLNVDRVVVIERDHRRAKELRRELRAWR